MKFEFSGECDYEGELLERFRDNYYVLEMRLPDEGDNETSYDVTIIELDPTRDRMLVQPVGIEAENVGEPRWVDIKSVDTLYAY